jgi:hypothetical protein
MRRSFRDHGQEAVDFRRWLRRRQKQDRRIFQRDALDLYLAGRALWFSH